MPVQKMRGAAPIDCAACRSRWAAGLPLAAMPALYMRGFGIFPAWLNGVAKPAWRLPPASDVQAAAARYRVSVGLTPSRQSAARDAAKAAENTGDCPTFP